MSNEIVIKARPTWQLLNLKELWQFRELLYIFTWRDIKVRYRQTALGVMWILLQPLVNTLIFTVFFGHFAKIPSGSLPYPVFVLVGLVFWGYFSSTLTHTAGTFVENEQLVKKVYFPRETLVFSTVLTTIIDFAITLGILFAMILFYRVSITPFFLLMLLLSIIITTIAATGMGLFLASVNVKYRDFRYLLPFFLQLLIFITPVIYPLSIVRPSFQLALALNPMTGVIDVLRSSLTGQQIAHPEILLISVLTAFLSLFFGLLYFRRSEQHIADLL